MGVVLRQAWSESQWPVLIGYLTISTNVIDSIKHITDDSFCLSGGQPLVVAHALCVQHSSTAAAVKTNAAFE